MEGIPMARRQVRGKNTRLKLSVVVPCFNEEDGLAELHRRVSQACVAAAGTSYEIVLVNDGSRDKTRDVIFGLAERDKHVVAIDLARNYGHQIALSAGLEYCTGGRILVIDADLQDPPELLPQLMAKMDEGFDVVYGQRIRRQSETWFKKATAKAFYRILRSLSDIEIPPDTGDFRLLSRRALDYLTSMPERVRFIRGMVSWIGLKQTCLPYERQGRFAGETHYPFRKMVSFAIDGITGFSVSPLRLASLLGIALAFLAFLALLYTLAAWSLGLAVPGWTSLASIVLIVGSVQLIVLGIHGEYIGRTYIESKQRPLYFVNSVSQSRLRKQ